jgi:hypothetical protein
VRDLFFNWTGVVAIIGFVSFIVFAVPWSPNWLSWPALALASLCGFRIMVVGDRRHHELKYELDIDNDDPERKRTDELVRILRRRQR